MANKDCQSTETLCKNTTSEAQPDSKVIGYARLEQCVLSQTEVLEARKAKPKTKTQRIVSDFCFPRITIRTHGSGSYVGLASDWL